MKKIITLFVLLMSCFSINVFAYGVDDIMQSLDMDKKNVSVVRIKRSMLDLVSQDVRNRVPVFKSIPGLESIAIYNLNSKAAIDRANLSMQNAFVYNKKQHIDNLLTISDGDKTTMVYAYVETDDPLVYEAVVLFNKEATDRGQLTILMGKIKADELKKIGSISK